MFAFVTVYVCGLCCRALLVRTSCRGMIFWYEDTFCKVYVALELDMY